VERAFSITDNVVIKIPTNIDYYMIPFILKTCVGGHTWSKKKFSLKIEEYYTNEILEYVLLYFGNTAQITLQEEIDVLTKYITPNPENLSHKQAIRNCVDRHGI